MKNKIKNDSDILNNYYNKINRMIIDSKNNIIRNINYEMVNLYYSIGKMINELIDKYHLEFSQNEIIKLFSSKLTK